jgi:hypothetical protein
MARAQSQYLRIFSGSTTYQRWQAYYVNTSVTYGGAVWAYQPFDADGITAGEVQSESSISIRLPATTNVVEVVLQALNEARLAELQFYEFDTILGNSTPQTGQTLIASYLGEVVGVKGGFTEIEMELGSSLAPVGAQVPPRTYSTRIIGAPCKL